MKYFLIVLVLASLACGATVSPAAVRVAPTVSNVPIVTISELENAPEAQIGMIYALGTVNVRACPSTTCAVIGSVELGAALKSSGDPLKVNPVTGEDLTVNCSAGWYPVQWRGEPAFLCGDWVSR